ncbi:hypothetical protein [Streptomyces sp. NRRL S-455]
MTASGPGEATTYLYPGGGHDWPYREREFTASWPVLAHALGVPE